MVQKGCIIRNKIGEFVGKILQKHTGIEDSNISEDTQESTAEHRQNIAIFWCSSYDAATYTLYYYYLTLFCSCFTIFKGIYVLGLNVFAVDMC